MRSERTSKTLEEVATAICPFPPMGLGNTICALGDAAALPVHSFLSRFRAEFEAHIREGRCPFQDPWGLSGGETPSASAEARV